MSNPLKVGIVGAGIQGISNALFLQKKGFDVTVFDREEPGSPAASYGNAGHFSPYASLSLNRTDVLADVPAMLMSSKNIWAHSIFDLFTMSLRIDELHVDFLSERKRLCCAKSSSCTLIFSDFAIATHSS